MVCLKEPLSGGVPFLCDDRALVRLGLGCVQLQPALGGHHGGSSAPVLGCCVQLLRRQVRLRVRGHDRVGRVLLFVDSEPVEAALIKGYSAKEDLCEPVGIFWDVALELKCSIYIDRVPTDSNPADPPPRGDLECSHRCGCRSLPGVWGLGLV